MISHHFLCILDLNMRTTTRKASGFYRVWLLSTSITVMESS